MTDVLTATGGVEPPPGRDLDHLHRCLRCQATAARLRRLGRALERLDGERYEPPPDLLPDTLRLLHAGDDGRRRRSRSRAAELAALAAAATGAAAGALVLGRRLRHVAS